MKFVLRNLLVVLSARESLGTCVSPSGPRPSISEAISSGCSQVLLVRMRQRQAEVESAVAVVLVLVHFLNGPGESIFETLCRGQIVSATISQVSGYGSFR